MPVRTLAPLALAVCLAACGGAAPTTDPTPASVAAGGSPAATGAAATGSSATAAPIDLSGLDACTLVPEATVEALTGVAGFLIDKRADRSLSSCFWGKAGAPQYLEVTVARRTAPLGDYTLTVNNVPCPATTIPGIGTEARGGVCPQSQNKVWLMVLDQGLSVQVIVNEPTSPLTPESLADVVKAVFASLG